MDNYYSSPQLFLSLYDKNVGACGTVRPNRKYYPKDLVVSASSVDRGFTDYRCSPPLVAWVWKDRRIIHFLYDMHEATGPATVLRTTVSEGERRLLVLQSCQTTRHTSEGWTEKTCLLGAIK